ncbi:1-deoxy-D-xylulose-5-phosphate synthase [Corynebacterium frankenforstense]|uniref:1-deoxy-D-xylulose-5-phosphate synthase n=1 Tax=Corynebacterium TaxID=1716 RepID=UPI00254EC4E8|nr:MULTISPECIES: 1-deoxy-D-xylulose-5-phosphate synthase [Corynebacterium]MDK6260316.1 1-deoxy-D-xylulose-5-phosphate synthase [Corynebacterium frankenforstense]MDK8894719.1 1-deoxy-D-xylulose-5-phosphate synthase [Corynebacterium sp. MSK006]
MGILHTISSPADLKALEPGDLDELCAEIRRLLIEKVSATGGHLGPNLGVVELTVALHRVFDSPREPLIFDTSHQSYVHKILTGRADQFDTLRQKGGLSGYTCRAESEHDWTESSHASAALSVADGMSKAFALGGEPHRNVVAVVGDGAMTGGMVWEALNNIAAGRDRNVVIVVNDNGRSYSPTIGGFADALADLRMLRTYDRVMEQGKSTLKSLGWVGERTFEALHAFKEGVKSQVLPDQMFPELGIKYIGPVNGHNLKALGNVLRYAREFEGPIIVHAVTEKGRGFAPAATESPDLMHSTGVIDPVTGKSRKVAGPSWTSAFSAELVRAGARRPDLVAITAAMGGPTGLSAFNDKFPSRFYDVGIAEQHAVTSAAGMSLAGLHPVVALYSTFLNRGFDQLLMDVGLIDRAVTFVLDRAGVTGSDGASHNGVWDMAITSLVPGLRLAAPRDGQQLVELFDEAIEVSDGPTVVRFPKGEKPSDIPTLRRTDGGTDVLVETGPIDDAARGDAGADAAAAVGGAEGAAAEEAADPFQLLVVSIGALAGTVLEAVDGLENRVDRGGDVAVTVLDPRWVSPVRAELLEAAAGADLVVTVEDGVIRGGIGSQLAEAMQAAEIDTPVRHLAFPDVYPLHASRGQLLSEVGLDAEGMRTSIEGWITSLADDPRQR